MKKCPKCGADNRPDNAACYKCFTSLEDVPSAEAPAAPGPLTGPLDAQPMPPAPPIRQAGPAHMGNSGGYQQQPPSPYGGPPPGPQGYSQYSGYRLPEPVNEPKKNSLLGPILFLILLLAGSGYGYWQFVLVPDAPVKVVRECIRATNTADVNAYKKTMSKNSMFVLSMIEMSGHSLTKDDMDIIEVKGQTMEEGKQYVLVRGKVTKDTAQVNIQPGPTPVPGFTESELPAKLKDGRPVILVKENGAWKVDILKTIAARSTGSGGG